MWGMTARAGRFVGARRSRRDEDGGRLEILKVFIPPITSSWD